MLELNFWTIFFTVLNLVLLCLLLRRFLLKPVTDILDKRKALVDSQIQEARKQEADARVLVARQTEALEKVGEQKEVLLTQARERAEEERTAILAEARQQADQLKQAAQKEILLERENAMKQREEEIARVAVAVAEKVLQQKTVEDAHLYDTFLRNVGETNEDNLS